MAYTPEARDLDCPECGGKMKLRRSRYGLFYMCENYPYACECTHGAHQETGEPLGVPADANTRAARIRAHKAFDKLWGSGRLNRQECYNKLRRHMDLRKEECHIGRFSVEQCREVERFAELCAEVYGIKMED